MQLDLSAYTDPEKVAWCIGTFLSDTSYLRYCDQDLLVSEGQAEMQEIANWLEENAPWLLKPLYRQAFGL